AAGLVHRDLKPSNLIIGDDGRVRVMDFGLVRARDELAELDATGEHPKLDSDGSSPELLATATRTGSLLGTPAYMAPEQFLGQTIDARTDQFSFCAVAWQALFGERPFAGDSVPELRYAVIHGRRRAPPSGTKVPGWLRDAIARGLAVDPSARWPSMTALLDALASGRRRAWTRRVAAVGLAVAVLSGAGWFTNQWYRARELAEATQACEAEGRTIDEIWNHEVRARLAGAFASSDSNLAADTWPRLAATIDGHAERWSSTRTRACIEAEVEDRRTPSALDSARACLDQRRATLASFVAALDGAEHTVISSASLASARLESPEDCLDVGESARRVPMPEDPELHERATALRERLVQVDLGVEIWRPDALSEAEATLREAEELDFAPLLAEAVYQVGSARLRAGDVEGAEPLLERALFLAAEQGIDHLAVDAAARLGYCAYEQAQFEEGLRWIRVGEMLVRRSNEDAPLIEAHLHQSAGGLHERRGAFDEAIAEYQRTLEIYERVLP